MQEGDRECPSVVGRVWDVVGGVCESVWARVHGGVDVCGGGGVKVCV